MSRSRVSRRGFLKSVGAATAASVVSGRLMVPRLARAAAPTPGTPRVGVFTPNHHTTYDAVRGVWEEAEERGFDSAFVFDHFVPIDAEPDGPCLEGWTLLAALAAQTPRLRVGVLVTGNTYRYPAVLAKMAATVDHVSRGRLILGMGAGWFEREHQAYGIPFGTPGTRARSLVEAVEVVKRLFTQARSDFAGRHYTLRDAPFEPKGVQTPHPPLMIGGMGPKVIQPLAARHADIWHFFLRGGDPAEARRINETFDATCREVGRDPAAVERAIFLRATDLDGRPDAEVRAQIQALAAAGVGHFIVSLPPPLDRRLLGRVAAGVLPAVREA